MNLASCLCTVLVLGFFLVSCSRTGDLTGDVFVTMKSCDVKRGAGVEIVLVRATEAFEAEWSQAQKSYQAEVQPSLDARNEMVRSTGHFCFSCMEETGRVARKYQANAKAILAKYQIYSLRTDVNGHFEAKAIPRGKIYLFAEYSVFSSLLSWFVAVEIKGGVEKIDLSQSNSGWPFKYPYT